MATSLRKQREVQQRELHLLEVARTMLIAQGYAGLSMDRLAEATEYSKGTVYQHFSTKEDLIMALASQTIEQRTALFERASGFKGRPRERMEAMSVADELFARLYPHSFRSELIIKMADLGDRASADRREALGVQEYRCLGVAVGVIGDAVALGDLPAATPIPRVLSAILALAMGNHTMLSNYRSLLDKIQVTDPYLTLRDNIRVLLDGFGWRPLSTEWDYDETARRIAKEVFADEFQSAGLDR